jgi:lipid-A-disaccharide synthase
MPDIPMSIFISAGDPSGDIAGSHLIEQIRKINPGVEFRGLGHELMRRVGQQQLIEGSELAVLGFWEVARKYFFFKKLLSSAVDWIAEQRPYAVILIDYPGFNLRLAEKIKPLGIPIIYYISPQIWAWGSKRINQIKKLIDLMLLILPFETDIYNNAGIESDFVGHYLLDDIDSDYIRAPYDVDSNQILLMPGSRPQEVGKMLPVLLKTSERLSQVGDFQFVIAGMPTGIDYEKYTRNCRVPVSIIKSRTRQLITESRLVLTSSGTATLEAGIIGRPMVVIYKTGWLTYYIARQLVTLDKIALINIVLGEKTVPELVQFQASPENIYREARRFLESDELSRKMAAKLNQVVNLLGGEGASSRAAAKITEYLGDRSI